MGFFGTSVFACIILLIVVGRARKCLDFAATAYTFHLLAVVIWSRSFPLNGVFWIFVAIGVIITTVLSEVACLRRELQEIPVQVRENGRGGKGWREMEEYGGMDC